MPKTLFILLLFLSEFHGFGQDTKTVTIYGHINSFTFTAPDGWELQERSVVEEDFGYFAFFFRIRDSKKYSTLIVRAYNMETDKMPKEISKNLEKQMKENGIVLKEEQGNDIRTNEGITAKVNYMTEIIGSSKDYQVNAHIVLDKDGVGISLMTRTKEELDNSYKAFESLVKSCVIRQMTPHEKRVHGN